MVIYNQQEYKAVMIYGIWKSVDLSGRCAVFKCIATPSGEYLVPQIFSQIVVYMYGTYPLRFL